MTGRYPRSLTPTEQGVLTRILSEAFEGAAELAAQVPSTSVVGGIPTLLDLGVLDSIGTSPCPDGPIPVRVFVGDSDEQTEGEILVWVAGGYLSGLEYAWFTDDVPESFPPAERLRFG